MNNKTRQHLVLAAIALGSAAAYVHFAGQKEAKTGVMEEVPASRPRDSNYVRSIKHENGASQVQSLGPPLRHVSNRTDLEVARGLTARGDFTRAEKVLREVLARTPDELSAAHELSTVLFLKGDYESSEQVYRSLLRQDPAFFHAHVGLGAVARVRGRYEDAVEEYSLALQAYPNDALSHFGRGKSYLQLGEIEAAEADLEKTLELLPQDAQLAVEAKEYLDRIKDSSRAGSL
jgi:tetratricopeptide (TPR) repeat protein